MTTARSDLAAQVCDWIEEFLRYPHGALVDKPVVLCPHERYFIERVLEPGVRVAALSMGRGNSKTTLCGFLATAAIAGPLVEHARGASSAIAAPSIRQGKLMFDDICWHMAGIKRKVGTHYTVKAGDTYQFMVTVREYRTSVSVLSSDPKRAHGLRANYMFADEPAQWSNISGRGEKLWAALRTSLGKIPGARLIALGTRPDREDHFFERVLNSESPRVAAVCHSADSEENWQDANPMAAHYPELRAAILDELEDCKTEMDRRTFLAMRCNAGISEVSVGVPVLEPGVWESLPGEETQRLGQYVLGIDLGGSKAFSSAAAAWSNGRCESFSLAGKGPSLAERDELDAAEGAYLRAEEAGELRVAASSVPGAGELVEHAMRRWGRPALVVADPYRVDELRHETGRLSLELRVVANPDQHAWALQRFQASAQDRTLQPHRCSLVEHALRHARVTTTASGQPKLARRNHQGRPEALRDDPLAALIYANAWRHHLQHLGRHVLVASL